MLCYEMKHIVAENLRLRLHVLKVNHISKRDVTGTFEGDNAIALHIEYFVSPERFDLRAVVFYLFFDKECLNHTTTFYNFCRTTHPTFACFEEHPSHL